MSAVLQAPPKEALIDAYQRIANKITETQGKVDDQAQALWDKLAQLDGVLLTQDLTPEEIVRLYRATDKWASDLEAALKPRVAYLKERMKRLENAGLALALAQKTDTFATVSGTMYKHKKTFLKIPEWETALREILSTALSDGFEGADLEVQTEDRDSLLSAMLSSRALEMFNHVLNKHECVAYRNEHGVDFPGTEVNEENAMGFRAPSRKRTKANEVEQQEEV